MPEFDTQTPLEQRPKPLKLRILLVANRLRSVVIASKPRIVSIANRLRALLIASKPRMLLLANRLRSLLVANKVRTLLIGGGIFLFVVVVPVGLLIYSSSGLGDQQDDWPETVSCDTEHLRKTGECVYPTRASMVCEAESRTAVNEDTYCREGVSQEELDESAGVTCDSWMLGKTGECFAPEKGDTVKVCEADSRY